MAAKLVIEVTAGVLPGEPIAKYGRRWELTAAQMKDPDGCDRFHARALEYAAGLMSPQFVNWVRVDWVWL